MAGSVPLAARAILEGTPTTSNSLPEGVVELLAATGEEANRVGVATASPGR